MRYEKEEDLFIVTIQGEMDHHAVAEIRKEVDERVEKSGCRNLILSLDEMALMDSAGIGFLVGRYKKRSAEHGAMALVGGNNSIWRILEMSGVHSLMPHYSTIKEAKQSFEKRKQEATNGSDE